MYIKKDKLPIKTPKYKLKCKNINIRVTEGEHARIFNHAKKTHPNVTRWLESLIFGDEACK